VVLFLMEPARQVLCELLLLGVLHADMLGRAVQGQLPGRPAGKGRRMLDVLVHRRALLVLDLVLLALGNDVDRGAVKRRTDLSRVERPVVIGVVPGEPALVAALLPEGLEELDGLDRALAVDHDLLAGAVPLGAAEIPQERIRERRRVAKAVTQRLADRLALGFELLARLAPLLPRPGGLGEPGLG